MRIAYPIHIIDIDGTVFSYDEDEARRIAGTIHDRTLGGRLHLPLGHQHVERIVDIDGKTHTITNRYIARDDHGQIITNADWPFKPNFPHWGNPSAEVLRAQELGLPIPYTSCCKGGPYKSRDTRVGEVRKQEGHGQQMADILVSGRNKPIKRKRPTPDWDSPRRRVQRCWKSQRKTQWK